jgi:Secretion system C-terminal sorting domain
MKKLSLILFLAGVIFIPNLYSQYFTFVRTSDSIVYGSQDTILDSWAIVNNITSSAISVHIVVNEVIVPTGWDTMGICTWQNCYAPGYFNFNEVLSPGPHDEFHVYTYPGGHLGTTRCKVTISYQTQSVSRYFTLSSNPIGIHQISTIVKDFSLSQNYPNPFNPNTNIEFSIPKSEFVLLKVYDILGREVRSLVSQDLTPGEYKVDFDGKGLSSGMYYYSLRAGDNVSVKKMVLVK